MKKLRGLCYDLKHTQTLTGSIPSAINLNTEECRKEENGAFSAWGDTTKSTYRNPEL